MHDWRQLLSEPRVLIAFLGWVGGAARGDHQALRDTWLKDASQFPNLEHRFFIGDGTQPTKAELQLIDQGWNEWITRGRNHGHAYNQVNLGNKYPTGNYQPESDEVMVASLDGYKYMSYKRRESCRWALKQSFDFMFCASVDVYCRPERLMASGFEQYDYHGMFCGNTGWLGTKSYLSESYIFGGGYWLSAKAAQIIAESPVTYWCEDWWVGMALAPSVRKGIITRHHIPWQHSKYQFCSGEDLAKGRLRYPRPDNDIISCELSAGNYNKQRMYSCHAPFVQPMPGRVQISAAFA